jgi:predicted cupin superfamily sugar epimerase
MKDAKYYIENLQMRPHPEGGYFKETYRSEEIISKDGLPARFAGDRNISTAIYYLLEQGDFSAFHRIKSDECWHFYAGETLLIHMIDNAGNYSCIKLGHDLVDGERFQFVVPCRNLVCFRACVEYSLCSCWLHSRSGFRFYRF